MVKKLLKLLNTIKSNFRSAFFIGLIVGLFFLTRLVGLDKIPQSLSWDEASIGYNAYSITNDLRDEWGEFLPLHFRAFGEFKLPVYVYATAFCVKIFGLNEFAVRLPAVLFSLGILIVVFLVTHKLTKNLVTATIASFYLAISPWLFLFSRTAHEAVAGVFFFALGILFFLNYKNKYSLFLSTTSFVLAVYSYNSMRIIIPIFIVLQTIYLIKLKTNVKFYLICLVIFAICCTPIIRLLMLDYGGARFAAVGESSLFKIINNYLLHLTPSFLFGGNYVPRSLVFPFGVLFPLDLPLMVLGIFYAIKSKNSLSWILPGVLAISFIPSSITKEAPHALRALSAVWVLPVLWSLGICVLLNKYKKYEVFLSVLFVSISLVSFSLFFKNFVENYNTISSEDWQYQYKQVFQNYQNDFSKYKKVIITDEYAQPYIFSLFYSKYDPQSFISEARYNDFARWGVSTVSGYKNFEFREARIEDYKKGNIIFTKQSDLFGYKPIEEIKLVNNKSVLYIFVP